MRIAIIGGGIFGCSIAFALSELSNAKVTIIEKESDILNAASKVNHNRLHLGYHYLRSIETAEQSIEGLLSFLFNFGDAVLNQFENYYAIAKEGSLTSTPEFVDFCNLVGIGYDERYPNKKFLNPDMVDSCFKVPEPIFDHGILKKIIKEKLGSLTNIALRLNAECQQVRVIDGLFQLTTNGRAEEFDILVNASYANLNTINSQIGINTPLKIRYEEVFIPYFLYPHTPIGLTVMDGKFCSIMPKGKNNNEFLLYHVEKSVLDRKSSLQALESNVVSDRLIEEIYEVSSEFYPFLKDSKHFGFWQTIRAIHDNKNDARTSEIFTFENVPNYYNVLSGKISTCSQVALDIKHRVEGKVVNKPFRK